MDGADGAGAALRVFERTGAFWRLEYEPRRAPSRAVAGTADQARAAEALAGRLRRRGRAVALLHGPPGTGKSSVPELLAHALRAQGLDPALVDSYSPADPGDGLSLVYGKVAPSRRRPLIVVLDEVDRTVARMHAGAIERHKHLPTEVVDKDDWCKWLDRIDRGRFPWLVLVMTTNRAPTRFDALDPAYLRGARLDVSVALTERVPTPGAD